MAFEKIITRESGDQVRILITNYTSWRDTLPKLGMDVFTKTPEDKNWKLLTQSYEEKQAAKKMSVDEYIKHGRHPMWYAISRPEYWHVINEARIHFGYEPIVKPKQ